MKARRAARVLVMCLALLFLGCGGNNRSTDTGSLADHPSSDKPGLTDDTKEFADDSTSLPSDHQSDGQTDSQVQDDDSDQGVQADVLGEELQFQNLCPQPIIEIAEGMEVPPQTILHLSGENSLPSAGEIVSYLWTVEQPAENKFNLVPFLAFPGPTHEVNVAGTYTYCLDVCDEERCSNDAQCGTTVCKKVVVIPEPGIHCELTWDTPGDPDQFDEGPGMGADMDLHFTHPFATGPDLDSDGMPDPWFDLTWDCFWYNPNPGWFSVNPDMSDKPNLIRSDTDGAGPESIQLKEPVDGYEYKLGVHYWDDHGFGPSYPMIKCWIFGQLVFHKDLKELGVGMNECDMWYVATIQWDSGQVTSYQNPMGGLHNTHCYQNPAFAQIVGDVCGCF